MEKQKRWQFYLILAVIVLTLYNIFPTVFFYLQPLKQPIDAPRAAEVAHTVINRVNDLEDDSKAWLSSFSKLLGLKPTAIEIKENEPRFIEVSFATSQEADLFKRFLPRAGQLIPFVPAKLELNLAATDLPANKVSVMRQIGIHLQPEQAEQLFKYSAKYDENGKIAPFYRELVNDRAAQLATALGGPSKTALQLVAISQTSADARYDDVVIALAQEVVDFDKIGTADSPIAKRYYTNFAQNSSESPETLVQKFLVRSETIKTRLATQIDTLLQEQKKLKESGKVLDAEQNQQLALLQSQRTALESANAILRKHSAEFKATEKPLTLDGTKESLAKNAQNEKQLLDLQGRNPYVQSLLIDWANDKIFINLYPDVQKVRIATETSETKAFQKEKLSQAVINEIARVSRLADENIAPNDESFAINLNTLTNTHSLLAMDLGELATIQAQDVLDQIQNGWTPHHNDLERTNFPINDYAGYKALKPEQQKLGLYVYVPSMEKEDPAPGFRRGSIYVVARGLDAIIQKYRQNPDAPESKQLVQDINQLSAILEQSNFIGYAGSSVGLPKEYAQDYIFEMSDYYSNLLKATREDFAAKGSKRYAVLDFTNVEQRILTSNKIADQMQDDLLKWRDEYNAAQVDLNTTSRYEIPAPTKNVFWENFKLSFAKYFRGDERKVLKWGLDLSGGKTVRIGLRDQNNKPVTNPDDLRQAVNELYTRINNMGVSERTIRIEGDNIILDFPGAQGLSAAELVKASAMYFHIVNEKFTPTNPALREPVNQFLQGVWNEAVVTNRKDVESINEIAWRHLGGEIEAVENAPRSESAQTLYDAGLRLANPKDKFATNSFNDTLSSVGRMSGEDFSEWDGQTHPLMVLFHNYALEGSSLTGIQVGYDPSEGNLLAFHVKGSYDSKKGNSGSPRDDFYAWTSQFAEDRIIGTPKEASTPGRGWRMAVVLNGNIISKPVLKAALRDAANISGRFTQREINQLAADLKAGSLSFTPRIMSEQNVSPELGQEERTKGIVAALVALVAVIAAMTGYYHFAGLVACVALVFNILIMWGVLQNLDAAITLPGIAGIVLTIGMAVDANVLVFERVREEFKVSGRIASAIQAGYRKAFSAIVDSNITTIIAALILIQFDSGPIKGFAVTLIIGIISSMFTSLFMTRYFFAGWVQNPNNKSLSMSQFFEQTNFDFLGQTKKAVTISLVIMAIGCLLFASQIKTIFGMDFTGGYSLVVELQDKAGFDSYRTAAEEALVAGGASSTEVQVRELSRPNQLRISLATSMEEQGHPFYGLPQEYPEGKYAYEYMHNPRIVWVVDSLAKAGLQIQPSQIGSVDRNWSVMSGQMSDSMRTNAALGLIMALIAILIYITFRFEFKYAVAAVIALVHDVVITLGILALFHLLGFPVQIDLQVVGAIMTIIGYSLNDTIIVFDRIREDIKIFRKMKFTDVCNHALNVTLSRTVMTSGTTLLVLLTMLLLGGKSIFAFTLVMTIGVFVGTLSSLYIATPAMIYFHDREERQEQELNERRV